MISFYDNHCFNDRTFCILYAHPEPTHPQNSDRDKSQQMWARDEGSLNLHLPASVAIVFGKAECR